MNQLLFDRASTGPDELSDHDSYLFRRFGWGPTAPLPHDRIHHAFERQAAARPMAIAVEHEGNAISYRELDRQANRLAARLAELGVRPGDNVALFVRRSIPMVVGLLAALKAGAAYVPQDARVAPESQLRHIVETAATPVILTLAEFEDRMPTGVPRIAVDSLMARPLPGRPRRFRAAIPPDGGCYVLFTSGTTGRPNGVTVTHRNVAGCEREATPS